MASYPTHPGPVHLQRTVYEDTTKHLVEDVLNGFCATVFAYGATGAGKTFTMVGSHDQPGIMVRALNDLFQTLGDSDKQNKTKVRHVLGCPLPWRSLAPDATLVPVVVSSREVRGQMKGGEGSSEYWIKV